MRQLKRFIAIVATAIAAAMAAAPSYAQLKARVEQGTGEAIATAVPDFGGDTADAKSLGKQIADVVRADLSNSGLFRMVDQAAFIERSPDVSTMPRFPDWTQIRVEALVVGKTLVDAQGNMTAQFRLFDVFANQQLFSQQYSVPTRDNWRRIAHKIADDVYSQLTGDQPYFDSRIVFIAESGPATDRRRRLAIMDQDGANAEFLTSGSSPVETPRFSPSSQTIIYSADVPDSRNPRITRLRVYLFDIESGRREVLSDIDNSPYFAARFSPDGRSVAMSREERGNTDIFVMDLAQRREVRLTDSPYIDTSPSFSPDGKQIVFTSDRSGAPQLYVMSSSPGGKGPCGQSACRISQGEGRYQTPVWSPRGDWIAFTKQQGGEFYIGVMHPDGSGERLITKAFLDEGPTWSPNGRVIAFFREAAPGAGPKLWSIDLTGQNLRRIPTPGDASDPAWSPVLR